MFPLTGWQTSSLEEGVDKIPLRQGTELSTPETMAAMLRHASYSVFEVEHFTAKARQIYFLVAWIHRTYRPTHAGRPGSGSSPHPPPPPPVALCEKFDSKYVSCLLLVARYTEIQLWWSMHLIDSTLNLAVYCRRFMAMDPPLRKTVEMSLLSWMPSLRQNGNCRIGVASGLTSRRRCRRFDPQKYFCMDKMSVRTACVWASQHC